MLEQLSGARASSALDDCATWQATLAHVARMFEVLLSGDSTARLFAWEQGPYVVTKPLWRQRAFSTAADMLIKVEPASLSQYICWTSIVVNIYKL